MLPYYPDNFEQKIGFDHIRARLAAECFGEAGRAYCLQSRISTKIGVVQTWLDQVAEYQILASTGRELIPGPYPDLEPLGLRLSMEGGWLSEAELHEVRRLLVAIESLVRFQKNRSQDSLPRLAQIVGSVSSLAGILAQINQALDDSGHIKDSASTELQRLRRAIVEEQRALRRRLDSILRQALTDGHAPEGAEITIRSGRLVIPVVAEAKRKFRGFVHDESATGQTVYMEPTDVLDGNNRVRELEYEARREVQRILAQLTKALHDEKESLEAGYEAVSLLDFIRAKARLAQTLGAVPAALNREGQLKLRKGRNPLLEEVLGKQGRKVIPLDFVLSPEKRILVVSGPNAGGKSAALKTVALLPYMSQFGLPIPALEGSTLPVFERFFVDIGDDQSLENDLSTYSSHLAHMRQFLEGANARSLVLIDEFGTGTDPAYGGPIAAAVLEELNRKQVYGLITTHYSGLKELASHLPGLDNGAMRFDVAHLAPLYELQSGQPGSSFALEVAQKTGLPAAVLAKAKSLVGKRQLDVDKLLLELEAERTQVEKLRRNLQDQKTVAEKLKKEYEEITTYLATHRNSMMRQAKDEARQLVQDANRKIEQTIREIREAEADKEITKDLRKDLAGLGETLVLTQEEAAQPLPLSANPNKKAIRASKKKAEQEPIIIDGPIVVGDSVRLKGTEVPGTVLSLKGNQVRVQTGAFTSTVNLSLLEKLDKNSLAKPVLSSTQGLDINQRMQTFRHQIDVRGLYPGDAMAMVEEYMDDALLLGVREVRILHGKGNGVLKTQIRNQLKGYAQVAHLAYDHPDQGGEGITIVTLA